jgi:orotate phosphoribosyltransferase
MKDRLIELILEKSFRFSKKPEFRLASGKMSNFYFNCKTTTLDPEGMYLIGNLCFERLKGIWSGIDAVGGLTLGADPIAFAISYTSYIKGEPIEAFVVRKEPKDHGIMQWIEGNVKKGDRVVIIEDVITSGASTMKAIERAQAEGLQVEGVMVLIDRQEGGKEFVESKGFHVEVILTREEIFSRFKQKR